MAVPLRGKDPVPGPAYNPTPFGGGEYGRRTIPSVIDTLGRLAPQKVFASIPISSKVEDGFRDITYSRLAKAIDRAAWWMRDGLRRHHIRVFAYMGPSDLRYAILAVAASKAGCTMFFPSPRNSLEGHLHLLDSIRCEVFLLPKQSKLPLMDDVLMHRDMKRYDVPDLRDWLDGAMPSAFPYDDSFENVEDFPFVMLHTSGSTGLPKIVNVGHGALAVADAMGGLTPFSTVPTYIQIMKHVGGRVFNGFPLFHVAGLNWLLVFSVYLGIVPVLAPAGRPLNADLADKMHRVQHLRATCLPPSVIEDLAKTPAFLRRMQALDYIAYGGAPLAKAVGNLIVNGHANLFNILGSTESPHFEQFAMERRDWEYIAVTKRSGVKFRPHVSNLHEMVVVREDRFERFQGVFDSFPELAEYRMKDLFAPHPDPRKRGTLWLYQGRIDDVIVFSNGEKLNPVSMEGKIQECPLVRTALVLGQGRFQSCVLIETVDGSPFNRREVLECLHKVAPWVDAANISCPVHGRIAMNMIIFTTVDKPMVRTAKGTVVRAQTAKLYESELDSHYEDTDEEEEEVDFGNEPDPEDEEQLEDTVRELVSQVIGRLDDADDFFAYGADSLDVLRLTRQLLSVRDINGHAPFRLSQSLIYANPTIEKLQNALIHEERLVDDDKARAEKLARMKRMFDQCCENLPTAPDYTPPHAPVKVAILTGSTGNLGQYLLRALVATNAFELIYCLNRSDVRQPQFNNVRFLKADLSKHSLGMPVEDYKTLLRNVTHVVHNAWTVDFNLPLKTFKSQLKGVTNLIFFSAASAFRARIYFISSISSIQNPLPEPVEPVLERIYDDFDMAQPIGYGESKHIAERLLARASWISRVPSSIYRVAQIAGPIHPEGIWNRAEWIPTMIASSQFLGLIPANLEISEKIDWIPIDALAFIIAELVMTDVPRDGNIANPEVLHLANPATTSWSALLPTIRAHFNPPLKEVEYQTWINAVGRTGSDFHAYKTVDLNPAVKIVDFYQNAADLAQEDRAYPTLDTTLAAQRSAALRGLGPITAEWMALWMCQWGFTDRRVAKD